MDGGSAVTVLTAAIVLPQLVAQHLGALHPFEKVLTLVLAFGPFVLLAVVVLVRRRQDAEDVRSPAERTAAQDPAEEAER